MKKIYKFYFTMFLLLSDFVIFAQNPGDENGGGDLEGNDPEPLPINSKLIILLILGLSFAFYKYKLNTKKS